MAESHVISALIKKRSELSGEIEHYEKLIKEYRENLTSIDKTIHIFDDSYDLRTIKCQVQSKNVPKRSGNMYHFVTLIWPKYLIIQLLVFALIYNFHP